MIFLTGQNPQLTKSKNPKQNNMILNNELEKLPDNVLVQHIKEQTGDCDDSIKILAARHSGLCYQIAARYTNVLPHSTGISIPDLIGNGEERVYDAAEDYDFSKNTKFSTWLGTKVRFHCLDVLKEEKKYNNYGQETLDFLVDSHHANMMPQYSIQAEADYALWILKELSDKRIHRIFMLRYFGKPNKLTCWADIAKKIKLSYQGVINLHEQGRRFLKTKLSQKNTCDLV